MSTAEEEEANRCLSVRPESMPKKMLNVMFRRFFLVCWCNNNLTLFYVFLFCCATADAGSKRFRSKVKLMGGFKVANNLRISSTREWHDRTQSLPNRLIIISRFVEGIIVKFNETIDWKILSRERLLCRLGPLHRDQLYLFRRIVSSSHDAWTSQKVTDKVSRKRVSDEIFLCLPMSTRFFRRGRFTNFYHVGLSESYIGIRSNQSQKFIADRWCYIAQSLLDSLSLPRSTQALNVLRWSPKRQPNLHCSKRRLFCAASKFFSLW